MADNPERSGGLVTGAAPFSFQKQQQLTGQTKSGERVLSGNRQRSFTGGANHAAKRVQSAAKGNAQTPHPHQNYGRNISANRRRANVGGGHGQGNAQPQQFNLQRQSVFQGPKNSKFFERESSAKSQEENKDGSEERRPNNDHVAIEILAPARPPDHIRNQQMKQRPSQKEHENLANSDSAAEVQVFDTKPRAPYQRPDLLA